jgi:hypothetical protein
VKRFSEKIMPTLKGSDGSALCGASCDDALLWGDGAPVKCGRRPNQKIQTQKPAAGFRRGLLQLLR